MHGFAHLIEALDTRLSAEDQVAALIGYFDTAPPEDAAWAVHLLNGGRLAAAVPVGRLRALACREAHLAPWLFDACLQAAGDIAETLAHVLPPASQAADAKGLAPWINTRLQALRDLPTAQQDACIARVWDELDASGRFLFNRLVTGGPVAKLDPRLLLRALANHARLDERCLAPRLAGWAGLRTPPQASRWQALVARDTEGPLGWPLGFGARAPWRAAPEVQGRFQDWLVQWLHEGVRAQIVKQRGEVWIWTAENELVTDALPEVAEAARSWPDGTVLEGVLRIGMPDSPGRGDAARLRQRMSCLRPSRKLLAEAPMGFVVHDLLQDRGGDLRPLPLRDRQERLHGAMRSAPGAALHPAPVLQLVSWAGCDAWHEAARQQGAQGLMLRHLATRRDGANLAEATTWVWRSDPLRVLAVLSYVQSRGPAKGNTDTLCSFAVWSRAPADEVEVQATLAAIARREAGRPAALQLVTITKISLGPDEMRAWDLDRWIQSTTLYRAGPVRVLRPTRVFELAFDEVQSSARHRCGLVLQGARVLNGRPEQPVRAAGHLAQLRAWMVGSDAHVNP